MKDRCMRDICVEIYKTLNDLKPGYIIDIFSAQQFAGSTRRPYAINMPRVNQTKENIQYEGARNFVSFTKLIPIDRVSCNVFKKLD